MFVMRLSMEACTVSSLRPALRARLYCDHSRYARPTMRRSTRTARPTNALLSRTTIVAIREPRAWMAVQADRESAWGRRGRERSGLLAGDCLEVDMRTAE